MDVGVRVEVVPWLTRAFGHSGAGRLIERRRLPAGTTLADLLGSLVREHPDFAAYALDEAGAPVCPHVCLTLGGAVIAVPGELRRTLRDGDVLVLLPQFAGGSG